MAETFFQKLAKKKGGSVEPNTAPQKVKVPKKKPKAKKEVE
tara:strand:+ start:72 stop:194 length:123 start_codon:yes stop_codon:yes gene_type:complete